MQLRLKKEREKKTQSLHQHHHLKNAQNNKIKKQNKKTTN